MCVFPKLCARHGHGFSHEITDPDASNVVYANVAGSDEGWRLAQLFAAAPALFEACRCALALLDDSPLADSETADRLRAAIAETGLTC